MEDAAEVAPSDYIAAPFDSFRTQLQGEGPAGPFEAAVAYDPQGYGQGFDSPALAGPSGMEGGYGVQGDYDSMAAEPGSLQGEPLPFDLADEAYGQPAGQSSGGGEQQLYSYVEDPEGLFGDEGTEQFLPYVPQQYMGGEQKRAGSLPGQEEGRQGL
jgi:hypothetical protein